MTAHDMETLLAVGLFLLAGVCVAWAAIQIVRGTL